MSARIEKTVPVGRTKTEPKIVGFAPEQFKAPFLLRCGALIIDYIVIVAIPVVSILISRSMGNDGAKLLNSEVNNTGLLIGVLLGLTNFVIFPMFSGKSLGKMLTGLRIVKSDGSSASFSRVLVRHLIGYPLTLATAGIGFLISALNPAGRALHDLISGTIVVYGSRRTVEKELK